MGVRRYFSRGGNAEPSPESRPKEGFTFVRGDFTFVQWGLTFEFDKNSTNIQCFIFQFWGAWSFVWGWLNPPKPPWRRDWGNVDILLIIFMLLTTLFKWTFTKRFTLSTPQRK